MVTLAHRARRPRQGSWSSLGDFPLAIWCALMLSFAHVPVVVSGSGIGSPPGGFDASNSARSQSLLSAARKAAVAGNLLQAEEDVKLALKVGAHSAGAYEMFGDLEIRIGHLNKAVAAYLRAIQIQPQSFAAHYNLGVVYLRQGHREDGERELRRAVALDPTSADASYNLGLILLDSGKPKQAEDWLHQAKTLQPGRPDITFNLVRAALEAGQANVGREEAREALKAFGRDATWLQAMGRLFLENGLPSDAVEFLNQSLLVRPDHQESRRLLAETYMEIKEPAKGLVLLNQGNDAEDYYLRAEAEYLLGGLPAAQAELVSALKDSPNNPRYVLLQSRILQRLGQYSAAGTAAQKAIRLAPNWADPYYSAAVSDYFLQRYDDALDCLDQAIKLAPRSYRAWFLKGITLVINGKAGAAEQSLRSAVALDPNNARLRFHLGSLLLMEGRDVQAKQAFEEAIERDPHFGLAHYGLGRVEASLNQPGEASREFEKAIQFQPGLAQAYYQLALIYRSLGETQKAEADLSRFKLLEKQPTNIHGEFIGFADMELRRP
jgi:tetratricopeptide (TPR) repeat protein